MGSAADDHPARWRACPRVALRDGRRTWGNPDHVLSGGRRPVLRGVGQLRGAVSFEGGKPLNAPATRRATKERYFGGEVGRRGRRRQFQPRWLRRAAACGARHRGRPVATTGSGVIRSLGHAFTTLAPFADQRSFAFHAIACAQDCVCYTKRDSTAGRSHALSGRARPHQVSFADNQGLTWLC